MKKNQAKIKTNDVVINIEDSSDDDSNLFPNSGSSEINNDSTTSISSTETIESEWTFCKITDEQNYLVDQEHIELNVRNLKTNYWANCYSNPVEINRDEETTIIDNLTSDNSNTLAINMSELENQQQSSPLSICSISETIINNQLNFGNGKLGILFPVSRIENIPGIINSDVKLMRYRQNSDDYIINIPRVSGNSSDITESSLLSKFFIKNWVPILIKAGSHLAATSILTATGFWTPWGLMPRIVGLIFGTGISNFYDQYIEENKSNWSSKELKKAQLIKIVLDAVIIAGTTAEIGVFNFNKLKISEQELFWKGFNHIFLDKIFFNYISAYFSAEQIIAIVHNVFSCINIFTKYNNKLIKGWDKLQQLTRSSLVISAFSILFGEVFNDNIKTEDIIKKSLVLVGLQLACTGVYIWLWSILKDIYHSLKSPILTNNNE